MEKDRKKKIITLLVIVFVTTLSIAYAAVSRTLNINGTAKMDTANWDVHFDNLSKANLINTAEEVNEPNYADNKGTIENINVKLKNPRDEVIYTVDIVNDGTMDAEVTVTSITDFTEEEAKLLDFGVYYSDGTKITKYDLLEAGKSKEVTIKLRYKDDITEFDLPEVPLTISFGFTINYIQSDASMVVTPNGELENVVSTLAKGSTSASTSTFYNGNITKESVESITFLSTLKVPKEVQSTAWDASLNKDGSVIAWYTDLDENNLYEVNIGGNGKVYAPTNCNSLFMNFNNLKEINFNNNFDTSNATNMSSMFSYSSITRLNLNGFNTTNVTNMGNMFTNCSFLTELNILDIDTSNVNYMDNMFNRCSSLININLSLFDTHKVINMSRMFIGCSKMSILDLSNFDTSNVTDMSYMFSGCSSLTSLDISNFSNQKLTTVQTMFNGCTSLTSLDLTSFNTSNVTNMSYMFQDCSSLTNLDLSTFNTSNVTDMSWMFKGCGSLKELNVSNFNTSNVTSMFNMFSGCSSLTTLDLSSFDTSKVQTMQSMFYPMGSITELKFNKVNLSGLTGYWYCFNGLYNVMYLDISEASTEVYSNQYFANLINAVKKDATIYVLNEECVTLGQAIRSDVNFVVKET